MEAHLFFLMRARPFVRSLWAFARLRSCSFHVQCSYNAVAPVFFKDTRQLVILMMAKTQHKPPMPFLKLTMRLNFPVTRPLRANFQARRPGGPGDPRVINSPPDLAPSLAGREILVNL